MKICKVISGNKIHNGSKINSVASFSWLTDSESNISNTVVPRYIAPRYIATLAYRHEIVKNGFPPMLIPPL